MILYHGGDPMKTLRLIKGFSANTLIAFSKSKNTVWRPWYNNLFIDSGAFAVNNSGKSISIDEYCQYLFDRKENSDKIVYASLDVIGNPDESYKNYKYMVKSGLYPIPVFHIGEDIKHLYRLAKISNYIGLGGTVGYSNKERFYFFNKVFSLFPDPKEIGFHGFGVNDVNMIRSYPWKSVDARSAHIAARFGSIHTPWGLIRMNPNMPSTGPATILWQTDPHKKKKIEKYLQDIGVDVEKTMLQNTVGKVERCKASIIYFEKHIKPQCPTYFKSQINYFL